VCIDAHERYPNHPDVDAEFKVLSSILGFKTAPDLPKQSEDVLAPETIKDEKEEEAVTSVDSQENGK
jgi:hypothetical protein